MPQQQDINLAARFPGLTPIRNVPSLNTVNGFGTMLYGRRDEDHETHSYVATRYFCVLFIPLIAVDAYRVTPAAEGGWYFLGKEPLSGPAKTWNLIILCCALAAAAGIPGYAYLQSPSYQAGQQLSRGVRNLDSGRTAEAAEILREVAAGETDKADEAQQLLKQRLDQPGPLALADQGFLYQAAASLSKLDRWPETTEALVQRGVAASDAGSQGDPRGANQVLRALEPIASDPPTITRMRKELLLPLVATAPDDVDLAVELAEVYENTGELEKCRPLLEPHTAALGETEGARIMGHLYAQEGKLDEAYELLSSYTRDRLPRYVEAEKALNAVYDDRYERVIGELNEGKGPDDFYRQYEEASEVQQQKLLTEHVQQQLQGDVRIGAAQEALIADARVVPVALEEAIVNLRRAQQMPDAAARKETLEQSEQTFLALQGALGDTDEYRLYLGQVYYWLGKEAEGHQLFDALLQAHERSPEMLGSIAAVLREVGAVPEARTLVEEMYNRAGDQSQKYNAAYSRALMALDQQEKIEWLRKSDPNDPSARATLLSAEGYQAYTEGRNEEAIRLLRQSTELWERQTQTVTTLNNSAIVSFTLFQLTGDPADAEQGAVKLQRAVSMSPTDSIITINAATSLSDAAFRDILGDRVDVRLLKLPGDHEYLSYLYDNSAELEKYVQLVKQHPVLAEALSYYQRVQLLAPKSTEGFQLPCWVHRLVRDDEALREVHRRVMQSEFDTSDSDSQRQRFISGQDDQKSLLQMNEALKRHYETLAWLGERDKDATFAVAAARLIETELSTSFFGRSVDFEGLLQLAEVAYAAAPSQGSRSTLIAALLALADQKFRNQDANYAQLAQQYERSLGPAIQIPVVLQRDAVFRELALGNEHLQRGLSLTVEQVEKIPEWLEPWHWALIRHSRPELADEWGARLAANDVLRMQREIAFQLAPGNSYWAYSLAWLDECSGDTQQAESVLETCRQHGTPLPE